MKGKFLYFSYGTRTMSDNEMMKRLLANLRIGAVMNPMTGAVKNLTIDDVSRNLRDVLRNLHDVSRNLHDVSRNPHGIYSFDVLSHDHDETRSVKWTKND